MKFFEKVIGCLTVVIVIITAIIHLGGMSKLVSTHYPETVISLDDIIGVPNGLHGFEMLEDGGIRSTSISAWIYIDYAALKVENPKTLEYEILEMTETTTSVPMYYVPTYVLQGVDRKIGITNIDLGFRTTNDVGLRLDFTNQEGKEFYFGNFVVNRNDLLVEKYLQWFECSAFYCSVFLVGVWIILKNRNNGYLSDLYVALVMIIALVVAFLGFACISFLLIFMALGLKDAEEHSLTSKFNLGMLFFVGGIGFLIANLVFSNYGTFLQMLFTTTMKVRIENVFIVLLMFYILNIISGVLKRNSKDFYVKISCRGLFIILMYLVLDIALKGTINSFTSSHWLFYIRNNLFSMDVLVNLMIISSLFFTVSSTLGVNSATVVLTVVYVILVVGNIMKIHFQGALFTVSDFFVLKETMGIAKQFINIKLVSITIGVLVLGGGLFAYWKRDWMKKAFKVSVNKSIFCFVPMFFITIISLNNNILKPVGIDYTMKYKQERDSLNSFGTGLYYYYMMTGAGALERPEGYDATLVQEVNQFKSKNKESDIKPNVILILAESLFRADEIPDVKFNYDIFKNTKPYIKGGVISPSYGGRTAVAEAEALTGYSNYFLENDTVIYTTYLKTPKRKIGSLAREFGNDGYVTLAMHPNSPSFYNRDVVYQCMGFDKFYSISDFGASKEDFLGDGMLKDEKFFDFLIQTLEESKNPTFVFGATIAGHSPYEMKYEDTQVIATSEIYNEKELLELSRYGQVTKEFDEQMGRLFDYLDSCETPTLVYVFGDHLPPIAINSSDGYLKDNELKYTTPLIAYSNYSEINIGEELMSLSQIAPQIIQDAGIKHGAYFDFMYEFRKRYPILQKEFPIEGDDFVKLYEKIQYDYLLGEQYLMEGE